MEFLRLLESIRIPALNVFFSGITYCGDEIAFMVVAFALFWCVNKRTGYYAFLVGLFGTVGNQWLKIACRIPRPWVLDPNFTIVESARAAATGYSFPSGHTQNAVGTFGAMALRTERKWVRGVCIALIVLVPFSRMYLGVHTPLDVGVAFLMAAALLALFYPVFRSLPTAAPPPGHSALYTAPRRCCWPWHLPFTWVGCGWTRHRLTGRTSRTRRRTPISCWAR